MPLEGYYEHGALNVAHRELHHALFRTFFTHGVIYTRDIEGRTGLIEIARDALVDRISRGHTSTSSTRNRAVALIKNDLAALHSLGFLDAVDREKESGEVIAYRISPLMAKQLHDSIRLRRPFKFLRRSRDV